jgi:t-SNARE complex subunit (syntaxin)
MTTVKEIERAIQKLDPAEMRELFNWMQQKVKERQEAESLPVVDDATFRGKAQQVLDEHDPLLRKLAE